jgi:hypothetical protein
MCFCIVLFVLQCKQSQFVAEGCIEIVQGAWNDPDMLEVCTTCGIEICLLLVQLMLLSG